MASKILVQATDGLASELNYADSTRVVEILRRYYLYMGLGPVDAAPQAMLDAVVASIRDEISRYAVQHYLDERRAYYDQLMQDEADAALKFINGTA